MIATSPTTPVLKLRLDNRRFLKEKVIFGGQILWCLALIFLPAQRETTWGVITSSVYLVVSVCAIFWVLVRAINPHLMLLTDEGVELRTGKQTWVVPFDQIREIRKDSLAPNFKLKFADRRFISDISGDNAEAFMTELSARSRVPILPPRFG